MYTLTEAKSLGQFTAPAKIQTTFDKIRDQRSVYLWSDTYSQLDKEFLMRYLNNNDINTIMVSPGKHKIGVQEFLSQTLIENKPVFLLIGENSYVQKGFSKSLKNKIKNLNPIYQGIHLDIEPQALEDWSSNKEAYLNTFVQVLKDSKRVLGLDKKLSVAVPVFFPENVLEEIFTIADEVVVMAYGNTDINYVERKLTEELLINQNTNKLTIALRATDFDNRIELEAFIDQVIDKLGVKSFAIQDLSDLIDLDQKTILEDIKKD